jgi:hypothetical protein
VLILERPWTRQPQGAERVNRGNKLADGVVLLWNAANPKWDAADGVELAEAVGVATRDVAAPGRVLSFASASSTGISKVVPTLDTSRGLSIHVIVNPSNLTATNTFAGFGQATGEAGYATLDLSGTESNDPIRVIHSSNGSTFGGAYHNSPPTNQWDSYTAVFNGGTTNVLFRNGVQLTPSSTAGSSGVGFPNIVRVDVGQSSQGAPVNRLTGKLALAVLWNRRLSAAEALSLAINPWQLFASQRIYIPTATAAGYTHPTLSLATATEITATSFKPRVTYTFA